jgi:DedD protein
VAAAEPAPAATQPAPSAAEPRARTLAAAAGAAGGEWAVQLGSFGEEANARRLAERVTTLGYKPDVAQHRASGRTMYRVRVGPHETRGQAEAAASALTAHGFVAQVVSAD